MGAKRSVGRSKNNHLSASVMAAAAGAKKDEG